MERNRFLNYFIYIFFTCYSYFTYFFFPIFLMNRGLDGARIGLLLMLFTITALISSFTIGLLEDRFGARGNTAFGLVMMASFYAGLALYESFTALVMLFILGGIGNNTIRITMTALFLKSHDRFRQGREIGLFNSLHQFFIGLGIIAGSFLIMRLDFGIVFIASASLSAVLLIVALLLRPARISVYPLTHYLSDLLQRRVIIFSAALFMFYLHWGAEVSCYAPFLKKCLKLDTVGAGFFMGVPIVFLAMCTYFFGSRRDRGVSTIRLAIIAMTCSGGGLILFSVSGTVAMSFFFRLVHEIGDAAFVIFTYVGIAQLFPSERLGGTSGSVYVVMIGAQAVGSWLFSWMGGEFGYIVPYVTAGLCSLSAIPLVIFARTSYTFTHPEQDRG